MSDVRLMLGDCLDLMRAIPDGSVDAVVTDPPYELNFMGRTWDRTGIAFRSEVWGLCLKALRPGSHLLAFGGTRTYHRIACAIEDAGFTVEDSIHWIYGQGFPKHKSKLKPAHEPIILAARPGGEKWLNVDQCRVASPEGLTKGGRSGSSAFPMNRVVGKVENKGELVEHPAGRWPTNLVFTHHPDCEPCGTRRVKGSGSEKPEYRTPQRKRTCYAQDDYTQNKMTRCGVTHVDPDGMETVPAWNCVEGCPIRELDLQSGERRSGGLVGERHVPHGNVYGKGFTRSSTFHNDSGGASRFFPTFAWKADDFAPFLYCSKASRSDRGEGNTHPTVKPQALMRWLCRLVTPEGGTVLDPFAGSGTTLLAAYAEGFRAIGIEFDPEYHVMGCRRIREALNSMPLLHDRPAP